MEQKIVINYRTRRDYCHCCDRKLDNPKLSEIREFEFNKHDLLNWTDWDEVMEFEDDLHEIVREYVYETIIFFATSIDDRLIIDKSEFDKVVEFVKSITSKRESE